MRLSFVLSLYLLLNYFFFFSFFFFRLKFLIYDYICFLVDTNLLTFSECDQCPNVKDSMSQMNSVLCL